MATERLLEANELMIERFQPKVKNRFIMYIDGIPAWLIKTATKPAINIQKKEIDYMNIKRYFAGKAEWQEIDMTLYDPVVPSAAQAVMEWVRLHHESLTGRDGYVDFYKKEIDLYGIGPVGDLVEKWRLYGAQITAAKFGDYDFTSDDAIEITLTLAYDWAVLEY
jgi:hypothetical protein